MSKRTVLKLVLLAMTASGFYLYWCSPSSCARRISAEMNDTPIGDRWFVLVKRLGAVVDDPENYIRYNPYSGGAGVLRSVLARRLIRDHATDLLPGIISILRSTKIATRQGTDFDDYRDRQAAVAALRAIGSEARPALEDLTWIIVNDPSNASMAIEALGNVGDSSSASVFAECLIRTDLDSIGKDCALHSLYQVGLIPAATKEKLRQELRNSNPESRYYVAIALGRQNDSVAAVVLTELLTSSITCNAKEIVADTLVGMPDLPDESLAMLSAIDKEDRQGSGELARRILRQREPYRRSPR